MNNYIINPSVFYWINTLNSFKIILSVIGWLLIFGSLTAIVIWAYNYSQYKCGYEDYKNHATTCKKITIFTAVAGLTLVVITAFLPGKTTSIEMLIAKTSTFDNVNWTVQQIKEVTDYIVNAINTIK